MLAWVFYMQPVGYAFAALMTLAVTRHYRDSIPMDPSNGNCDADCFRAVDRSWRIIIGIGAVPALIAVFFRRSIPESLLYTADVINQTDGAIDDFLLLIDRSRDENVELGPLNRSEVPAEAPPEDPIQATPEVPLQASDEDPIQATPEVPLDPPVPLLEGHPATEDDANKFSHRWYTYWASFSSYFFKDGHWRSLLGVSLAWFLLDTSFYALGSSSSTVVTRIFNSIPLGTNIICTKFPGNLQNCTVLDPLAQNPNAQSLYGGLFANSWRSLILVCSGSLIGGAIMIALIEFHSPRFFQIFGFLALIPFFLVAGLFLILLKGSDVIYPTATVYLLAQGLFEVGPNFTTFMLPAEIFPTRHRAFAHGIAAGSGKLGASLFQVFFQFVKFYNGGQVYTSQSPGTIWLGFTVLCFMPTMLSGALVTYVLIPQTRSGGGEINQPLDELEKLGAQSRWGKSIVTAFLARWLGPAFGELGAALYFLWTVMWNVVSCLWCRRRKTERSLEIPMIYCTVYLNISLLQLLVPEHSC
jgi:PHS family inorganic phosphate transporter-like MFS transporter